MGADDQQLELLGALEALGGSAGNGKLRDLLGWDEATYEAVKAPLVASGQLQPGRGCGGSLSLVDEAVYGSSAAAHRRPERCRPQLPTPNPAASKSSRPSS
jgi:type I restriction enzyme M protein